MRNPAAAIPDKTPTTTLQMNSRRVLDAPHKFLRRCRQNGSEKWGADDEVKPGTSIIPIFYHHAANSGDCETDCLNAQSKRHCKTQQRELFGSIGSQAEVVAAEYRKAVVDRFNGPPTHHCDIGDRGLGSGLELIQARECGRIVKAMKKHVEIFDDFPL